MSDRSRAQVKGTLTRVLRQGGGGEPFRALMLTDTGRQVLVTSKTPLDALAGDDIAVTGWLTETHDARLADELVVNDPNPAYNRMRRLLAGGAQVLSFGAITESRPFMALTGLLPSGVFTFFKRRDRVTVIESATQSRDPIITWAAKLMQGVSEKTVIAIVNPDLLGGFDPARPPREKALLEQAERLRRQLPAATDQGSLGVLANTLLNPDGKVLEIERGQAGRRQSRLPLVIPFRRIETGRFFEAGISGLSAAVFAPRRVMAAGFRQSFVLAHELSHTVQAEYQTRGLGNRADRRWGECYADAFGLLAALQKTGDFDSALHFARLRQAAVIHGNLVHWTGPAALETVALARGYAARGELAKMSAKDMLTIAQGIANRHALPEAELDKLLAIRNGTLALHGLKTRPITRTLPGVDGMIDDASGGLAPFAAVKGEFESAGGNRFGAWRSVFADALQATAALYFTPGEQAGPNGLMQVNAVAVADLHDSILCAGGDSDARGQVLKFEIQAVKMLPDDPARAARLTLLESELQSHQADRSHGRAAGQVTDAPFVVIRPAKPTDALGEAMAQPPLKRVESWHSLLKAELDALNRAVDLGGPASVLNEANRLAARRLDFAHAIRIDSAGWRQAKSAMQGHTLFEQLIRDAGDPATLTTAETMHAARTKLARLLHEPLPVAVTGAKPKETTAAPANPATRGPR